MSDAANPPSRWSRLCRHPVFPLIVYLALTQAIRDNYPFSHYPMYSKPNSESLSFQFLADVDGKPIAVMTHTGLSPSQLGKMFRDRSRRTSSEKETALAVLDFIRSMNEQRKGHELPDNFALMEMTVRFDHGHLEESTRKLAATNER